MSGPEGGTCSAELRADVSATVEDGEVEEVEVCEEEMKALSSNLGRDVRIECGELGVESHVQCWRRDGHLLEVPF